MRPDDVGPGADGPGHPLQALALDLLGQAQRRAISLTFAALEHLLSQQPWARARLAPHAGSVVLIGVSLPAGSVLPAPELRARVDAFGTLQAADDAATADASVWLEPSSEALFAVLRDGPGGLQRHLRVEGDVRLAATLAELSQHLRWDAAEDLSQLIGDVAAHRAAGLFARAASGLRDAAQQTRSAFDRFLADGGQVANRPQWADLLQQAAGLDQRLRSLEARVRAFTGPRSGAPG